MRKVAAIDIGTNSMRLLLCEIVDGRLTNKEKSMIVTRLGKNVSVSGLLSEEAIVRNMKALSSFGMKAKEYGAERVVAIATSAVRDAANRAEFVQRAKTEAGIDVMIIPGKEEAELGIMGVMSETEDENEAVLVLDIGGGSTELVLGRKSGIEYSISVNAGTVRMTEGFISGHPIPDNDILELHRGLERVFEEPIASLRGRSLARIIGIGGTATTAGAMYNELGIYNPKIVHNSIVSKKYLEQIFEKLKNMTVEQRYSIKGLQKERADVIPAGIYILKYLIDTLNEESVTVSENDNLEGAILKYVVAQ